MRLYLSYLFVFFLFPFCFSHAQSPPEINGQYVTVPPSPTSFEFTKYGNTPVNEYKGMISPSIPLYVYKAGHLTLPISMSYSGNGVKLAQLSTWTGINWNLNAGGVITRTVKDRPDELPTTNRLFYSSSGDFFQLDPGLLHNIANPAYNYDTQLDEFNFRFLNYFGSFYLDENHEFKLAACETELKIESLGAFDGSGTDAIVITTPDGVQYYFGGDGFVEQSEMLANGAGSNSFNIWNTSYYLAYIIHPKGDRIDFTYGTTPPYQIRWSSSEKMTFVPENSIIATCYVPSGYSPATEQLVYNRISNGRYLQKITSNISEIVVDFHSTPLTTTSNDFVRALDKIEIHNPNSTTTKNTFDFYYNITYSTSNNIVNTSRFFLTKITPSETGEYKFEYYNLDFSDNSDELPDRFSYAQDFFGYYNGKNSNETLLPINSSQYFPEGANGVAFADRFPAFEYAVTGALKKITYPTTGHTLFEYESNPKKIPILDYGHLKVYSNMTNMVPENKYTDGADIGSCLVPIGGGTIEGLHENQNILFNLNYTGHEFYDQKDSLIIEINETYPLQKNIKRETIVFPGYINNAPHNGNFSTDVLLLKNHCYSVNIELKLSDAYYDPGLTKISASLNYSYIKDYGGASGIGLRIKRVTDYTEEGKPTNIKRYYYQSAEQYMKNKQIYYSSDYTSSHLGNAVITECSPANMGMGTTCVDGNLFGGPVSGPLPLPYIKADTHNSTVSKAADGFSYEYVTISYGGDNFEKGGVEKRFNYQVRNHITNGLSNNYIPAPFSYGNSIHSNRHALAGKLLHKKYLILVKDFINEMKIKKTEEYIYSNYWTGYTWNCYFDKYYGACSILPTPSYYVSHPNDPYVDPYEGFFAGFYRSFQIRLDLDTIREVEYIDPLPVLSQDNDSGYAKVVKETYFEYGQYIGLPTKITKTTSEADKFLVTKNYYPGVVPNPLPSPSEILRWSELASEHRISSPIQTETFLKRNGSMNLLNTKRTYYDLFNGMTLPSSIEFAKGHHNLEKRVDFLNYNPMGRLTKLKINEGSEINYQYDNYGKITSKIEGSGSEFHVTAYEYDGMDRLIKVTDPRGYEMNYSYDPAARLEDIRDHDDNLLKSYEYHYDK